jgi:glutathione-regulated potassium-efflux system ancillary protein KefG
MGMVQANRVLVLFAHPALEKSRVNRKLIQAIQGIEGVTIHDLYERYPHLHIQVKAEQALLLRHDVIVFQHPFYWYSSPAIIKEWQDVVLEYGFAYGHEGVALQGKKFLTAITTGGGVEAYRREGQNFFTIRELLAPFEQTARLCGMEYLPPFVIQSTPQLSKAEIQQHASDYRQVILGLQENTLDWAHLKQVEHFNHNLANTLNLQEATHHA